LDDTFAADGTTPVGAATVKDCLVTYEKDGNDYDLRLIGSTNKVGYDNYYAAGAGTNQITAATDNKAGKLDYAGTTYAINDNAVVFLKYNTDKVKVVTGAVANSYKDALTIDGTKSFVLTDTTNNVKTAMVVSAVVTDTDLPNAYGDTDNYAVVLSGVSTVKIDGTKYVSYDIWNGSAAVTVREEGTTTVAAEGAIIQYTDLGDNEVDDVALVKDVAGATAGYYAVDGYAGNDLYLVAAGATYDVSANSDTKASGDYTLATNLTDPLDPATDKGFTITKDTVVLYVDTEDDIGNASGAIQIAKENLISGGASDGYFYYNTNVFAFDEDKDGELELVVVEVTNQWH